MTAPGPQDPTIAYLVHRGALIGIVLTIMFSFGVLRVPCRLNPSERRIFAATE